VPQPLDLGVDRRVLLDEGVGLRDVGLGLVVVVVADEVLDGVVRHELAELGRELRRERLVVREHERRALHLLDRARPSVADLPVPVAPSSTTSVSPALMRPASSAIAAG
jgi:hypothetical protein